MNHATRSPLHFAALLALLIAANASAQDARIQRQPKSPTTTAPAAVQTRPNAQDPYRQRAGIVIEMAPSPDRKLAVKPKP